MSRRKLPPKRGDNLVERVEAAWAAHDPAVAYVVIREVLDETGWTDWREAYALLDEQMGLQTPEDGEKGPSGLPINPFENQDKFRRENDLLFARLIELRLARERGDP